MAIGNFVQQTNGYTAYIPQPFPPQEHIVLLPNIQKLNSQADLAVGKLDGIAQLIDIDFFTYAYVRKEATLSSNIEGTKATMHDALKAEIKMTEGLPRDVENILHYVHTVNYGVERLKSMPISLRFVRELHQNLMEGTAEGIGKTPGEFRTTQNWIGGTRPGNADFVPPPPYELSRVLGDLEKFMNLSEEYPPLIKAALMHAQFETIHPFLDGNGRTGRLLVILQLIHDGVLEYPVLYLSEYFKRHRTTYFDRLMDYRHEGGIERWLEFFLEGVVDVAEQATEVSKAIVKLRERHLATIMSLSGKQTKSASSLLIGLYKNPIVDIATVVAITGLSRPAANALVQRFIGLGILQQIDDSVTYGREFAYAEYLELFEEK